MLTKPTLSDIMVRMKNDLSSRVLGSVAVLRMSMLYILVRVFAGAMDLLYRFVLSLVGNMFVSTAVGPALDVIGQMWGVFRQPATFATGPLLVTGTPSTTLPAGTEFTSTDNSLTYSVQSDVTLDSYGNGTAIIVCETAGSDGDLDVGAAFTLFTAITNINSAATAGSNGITSGDDVETDDHYRSRILERIQFPPAGGSVDDYEEWAASVPGVNQVWVTPIPYGPGTVLVTIAAAYPTPVPSDDLVAAVLAYLTDPVRKPVTALISVAKIIVANVGFQVSVDPLNSTILDSLATNLANLLINEGTPGGAILLAHINKAIIESGVNDYLITGITVNESPVAIADVVMSTGAIPVYSEDDSSYVEL